MQRVRPTSKGLPKGVSGPVKGGKFQGRVTFKPLGITQRSIGLFETPEAAGLAVEAAEQQLAGGGDPWSGEPVHTRKHKRGEVRCSLRFSVAIRAHLRCLCSLCRHHRLKGRLLAGRV